MPIIKLRLKNAHMREKVNLCDHTDSIKHALSIYYPHSEDVVIGTDFITLVSSNNQPNKLNEMNNLLSSKTDTFTTIGDFTDEFPCEFYGIALDYVTDRTKFFQKGISFELVDVEAIKMLFNEDAEMPNNANREPLKSALQALKQHGINSTQYRQIKSSYLGSQASYELNTYMDNTYIEDYPMCNWFRIEIDKSSENPNSLLSYEKNFEEDVEFLCKATIYPVDNQTQAKLKAHFQLEPSPKSSLEGTFKNITPATAFSQYVMHDVEQGLCTSIHSNPTHDFECFFDIGYSKTRPFYPPKLYPADLNTIVTFLQNAPMVAASIPVIISHWHRDHYNALKHIAATPHLGKLSVCAPEESAGVQAQGARQEVLNAGGTMHLYGPTTIPVPLAGIPINGNPNFILYKMQGGANSHLHHNCIYATLTLNAGAANPTRIFLAGDCTYSAIPANIRDGQYDILQVSHHGGDYHCGTPNGNHTDIPEPSNAAGATPAALYSYGTNNIHGHPEANSVNEHRNRGWLQAREKKTVSGGIIVSNP